MTTKSKPAGTSYVSTAAEMSQYYTNTQLAAAYVERVLARYVANPFDTIIEPSAGTGAFSRHLGPNCIALDLDPKAPGIIDADFLSWSPTGPLGRTLIIGNPPFRNNTALAFLNHAASLADVVALILPASFCKMTMQNRVDTRLHLVHEEEVPQDAFIYEGKTVHVPCVLQIWERRSEPRQLHALETEHPHFERCSQAEADLVIRRVGAHAGQLKPVDQNWSPQSNIFLRATGCNPKALEERFARLDMSKHARNGAGGGSINMSEIIELYVAALAEEARTVTADPAVSMPRQIAQEVPAAPETQSVDEADRAAQQATPGAPAHCEPNDGVTATAAGGKRNMPEADAAVLFDRVVIDDIAGGAPTREAIARFNSAAAEAQSITITVPLSFRKTSVQNQLDSAFHLVDDIEATVQMVGSNGRPRERRCAIQIWERRAKPRPRPALETRHPDYEFCSRAEADFAIQRVGGRAGRLKMLDDAGSAQSHLFLRAMACSPAELWARFDVIDFDMVRHNTAAVPSIAKSELVALYDASRRLCHTADDQVRTRETCSCGAEEVASG
ncbi:MULTISPECIES: hypothetical protein [Limimaricola]|jgi:hypothetical protein|uniref:SAM-dependent methyltransferase n=1 Tax=Limimaricola cinnabarinus TaxID=1125964 RepID=A0A2G1MC86_9RHOB|nr:MULTISPECIES: hypothetical protein [Limimaricola]MCZ4262780.1 hypothetical protein [Limimaricola sp. G21655-S1]PHP26280.1 hypothetical protein CJ301_17230 [Limimaricola cinnabarinus]